MHIYHLERRKEVEILLWSNKFNFTSQNYFLEYPDPVLQVDPFHHIFEHLSFQTLRDN